jgi:S-adenosylmethionine decarboxylase
MKDLAPDIVRQRLLIEGLYSREVDQPVVESYLIDVAAHLGLRTYGRPIVHAPGGAGKDENQGFDAFIPLIDSGISLYVWSQKRFFATVLFTCKSFDLNAALRFTRTFFAASELEHRQF